MTPRPDNGAAVDERRDASPATSIVLIRHGETEWNRLGLYQGTTDLPLNRCGREQAEALARRLRGVPLRAAYSSPLRRATETAGAVLRGRALELTTLPGLRELCYGLWQGRSEVGAARCDAGLVRRWREAPWSVRFPGGETLAEVRARATSALETIRAAHPGETVLVSGHGHLNRVLIIAAMGWPLERFWKIEQENASACRLRLRPEGTELTEPC